jgi:hypothetical protein
MGASPPNLLTLPRELRDHIYSYLTHQLDFNWHASDILSTRGADGNIQLIEPVSVRLVNCPFPSILCVHPLIYEEYHTACVGNLEAIIDPALQSLRSSQFRLDGKLNELSDAALACLRHVKLFITLHAKTAFHNLDWQQQLNLLHTLIKKADAVVTLRVAVRQQHLMDSPTFNELQMPSVLIPAAQRLADAESHPFLPNMPLTLDDMQLVQRGDGYHVGYAPTYLGMRTPVSTMQQSTTRTYTINGREYSLSHAIRKIGVYMYTRGGEEHSKRLWTVGEVVERWSMRKYPREAIESVSAERGAVLARSPFGLSEWVEKRGAEDLKDWASIARST